MVWIVLYGVSHSLGGVVHSGPTVPQRGLRRTPLVVPVAWRVSSTETGAWKTQGAQVRALRRVEIRSLGLLLWEPQDRGGRMLGHWGLLVLRA